MLLIPPVYFSIHLLYFYLQLGLFHIFYLSVEVLTEFFHYPLKSGEHLDNH